MQGMLHPLTPDDLRALQAQAPAAPHCACSVGTCAALAPALRATSAGPDDDNRSTFAARRATASPLLLR